METLSDEIWDVIIAGTSIPQSLLALSLSHSEKKVLHVDQYPYYGGVDAGLSLQDAETWAEYSQQAASTVFKDASISRPSDSAARPTSTLAPSRSYILSLNPQIIYAKSEFLPALVSSQIHTQLEFLAVGSWWVLRGGQLHKIPSTREDVFNDESLSMKDKRGLMKFLRYVLQEEDASTESGEDDASISLKTAMSTKFKIPESLQAPLVALALSPVAADSVSLDRALARIRRHMRSMGYFGQGFGAVIAKFGGNSEISQVACRAQAVGGGVYLLGHGLRSLDIPVQNSENEDIAIINTILSDGTQLRSRYVAGGLDDIPLAQDDSTSQETSDSTWRSVNVIADPLRSLFPPTSENGPNPAVAIVLVEDGSTNSENPVYLQIHSEDTGECPSGQCIIYASVVSNDETAKGRLEAAVSSFLESLHQKDSILWSMSYRILGPPVNRDSESASLRKLSSQVLIFPPKPHDLAFDDSTLHLVKEAWETVLGEEAAADRPFLRFEERAPEADD